MLRGRRPAGPSFLMWRESGRPDSNRRPRAPKARALTKLRHAPPVSIVEAPCLGSVPRSGITAGVPGGVEPSNLDKVFWPDAGLTKGDLLQYFESVAGVILPALRDRPLTVKRYPDGIDGFSFFQKNTPKYAPPWVKTIGLWAGSARREVQYPLCNSKRTLLWLANQPRSSSIRCFLGSGDYTDPTTSCSTSTHLRASSTSP